MKLTKENRVDWYGNRFRELAPKIGTAKALKQAKDEVKPFWKEDKKQGT